MVSWIEVIRTMLIPFYLILLLLVVLGLPTLFVLLYLNVAALSLERLGVSPAGAFALFALSLLGSVVNVPVSSRRVIVREPFFQSFPMFFFYPPVVREEVVAVNLGGAIIPTVFSLYLLPKAGVGPALLSTIVVAAASYAVARPVAGRGITLPAFVPPLAAALSAFIFKRNDPAAVAYIAGTVGTLIGADLMHLPQIRRLGPGVLSIGGAGVYDGIFLAGLLAAFLA